MESKEITVEVAYALPDRQKIIECVVQEGCTALAAVKLSNIVSYFPEIDIDNSAMGIFSKLLDGKSLAFPGEFELRHGDRVEIYRPLDADPKEARKLRVEKARKKERQRKAQEAQNNPNK